MIARVHARPWLLGGAVCVVFLLLYATSMTAVHTFDALSYILDVSRKPWQQLFHPHHLAYGPLGAALRAGAALLGSADVALALQLANVLAGSLSLGVFAMVVYRRWQRLDMALLAACGCGVSYAFWYYAVEVEVYTIATLWCMLVLALCTTPQPTNARWQVALGCCLAAAVLFHQTNALLALPLLVRAWPELSRAGLARRGWLQAGALGVGLVVTAYAWVMWGVSGFRDSESARRWLFDYVASGWWGGRADVTDVLTGIADTIADHTGAIVGILLLIASVSAAIPQRTRTTEWWLVVWLLTYAVFFSWWEPDNIEFWIGVTPIAILLLLTPLATLPRRDPRLWLVAGLLVYTGWTNHAAIRLRGDAGTDLQRRIASAVRQQSDPADLLLIPDGLQELYLPFYEQREHFLSVNAAIAAAGSWEAACTTIQTAVTETHRAGARVLVASDFLEPSQVMQQRYGLDAGAVQGCVQTILPLLRPLDMPAGVPAHLMLPRAGELLRDNGAAALSGAPLGWSLLRAESMPSAAGWALRVAADPVIMSPLLGIPMPRSITVTLAATDTADRVVQLFVATQPNIFDEAHASTQRYADGRQSVRFDLTTIANLPPELIQLRIDPVADGAGGIVTITGITVSYDE